LKPQIVLVLTCTITQYLFGCQKALLLSISKLVTDVSETALIYLFGLTSASGKKKFKKSNLAK